jgi:hypothetical protein
MVMNEQQPLRMIHLFSWVLLSIMIVVGWLFFDLLIVRSLLVGGLLANISFWSMKRDLTSLLQGELTAVKTRFFLKYYSRLAVLSVVLFFVIRFDIVNVIGLLAGLSTVFISIALVAIDGARKEINIKEAS